MSTPDNAAPEAAFFAAVRRWGIVRGPEGIIGGVVSGAGARIKLAAWPSRLIVIVAALLLFPVVMLAYAFGWAVLPDAEGRIVIQDFGRGVTNVGALIGIAIFGTVGLLSFSDLRPFGRAWFGPGIAEVDGSTFVRVAAVMIALFIPVAILAGVVLLIVVLARRSSGPKVAAPQPTGPAPIYALTPAQARAAAAAGSMATATGAAPVTSPTTASATLPPEAPRTPPVAPGPMRPRPPRVPGPGAGFSLLVLAWALISAAGTIWASREGLLAIYAPLAWGMVFLTGLGVILIMVSLSGRKLGFLGFLGGIGMFPAFLLLLWHPALLESYADNRGGIEFTVTEVFDLPQAVDPTTQFADDYQTVLFAGHCWQESDFPLDTYGGTARITVPSPLEADATYPMLAATTTVVVPAGTALRVTSDGWAQATVHFADRDLTCDYPGEEGEYVLLTNPGAPLVTLTVTDDAYANTIVIEEN